MSSPAADKRAEPEAFLLSLTGTCRADGKICEKKKKYCPAWVALTDNVPAPGPAREAGPGDWPHGWQFHASRTRTNYFRDGFHWWLMGFHLPLVASVVSTFH